MNFMNVAKVLVVRNEYHAEVTTQSRSTSVTTAFRPLTPYLEASMQRSENHINLHPKPIIGKEMK